MIGFAAVSVALITSFLYFIVFPVIAYFLDPKGFRRYQDFRWGAGITNLSFIWEAHQGFRSLTLSDLHQKHPVLRIGPNSLSFSDPRAIKDIYGHATKCSKDNFYSEVAGTHFHLADVIDKAEHARKRRVLSSAFAIKNLVEWEYKVSDMTGRMVKAFDKLCTEPLAPGRLPTTEDLNVDFRNWSNLFTIAAIANIGLSEDIGFLDRGDDHIISETPGGEKKLVPFRDSLFASVWTASNLAWAYGWYGALRRISKVVSSTYRRRWAMAKDWDGIVYNRATTRLQRYQAGEKCDDFFTSLMEDKTGNPNDLPWGEIVAEISIMMNAGSDTTAIAINGCLYNLMRNPDCLAKLRSELDEALHGEVIAPYEKVKRLPYLRACLDENLRIQPPVSFGLPRKTPPEGAYVAGDFIPGNTSVSMSAYVVHHNKKIFEDPEVFRPERWLGDAGKELQQYFVAFSTGARGCIGRNISYLEQTILIATLVHRYDFALPSPTWQPVRREMTTIWSGPMPIKLWRRQSEQVESSV
ncbi:cytochrome P450 monooxygenase [Myriangium duriaei CBS 260.36]|uniref:Cytochrome P450 monooxygenase n=1 Tax=Myriangium duriaei CBS 260.36 TaxID=1168546 RepID=A0A9P4J2H6_9PEZI|nr:cytochrome P450 monooxygenase [Myriangium duriaei CBS 260.36]